MVVSSRSKEWGVLRNIFLLEDTTDREIIVENEGRQEGRFPCHSSILNIASGYFKSKFSSWETTELTLEGVRPRVVMALLEFIYFGWVALEGWEFMLELHKAAVEYSTPDLVDLCETSIIREINPTNICSIFESAIATKSAKLMSCSIANLRGIGFLGLNEKAFRESSEETVVEILRFFKEEENEEKNTMAVFKALWEWCAYNCSKEIKYPTEYEIVLQMEPLYKFLDLQELSEEELESLPKGVLTQFRKTFPDLKLGENKHDCKGRVRDWREHTFLCDDIWDCSVFVKTSNSLFRFPCNKKILSDASRVFAELFQNMAKKSAAVPRKMCRSSSPMKIRNAITVDDISPSTMYTIVMHAYINKTEFKGLKSVCAIYIGAHRYKLIGLIPHCHDYMERIMTPKNVCALIECAISTGSTELLEICKDFIWKSDITDITNSRAFQEMSPVTLSIAMEFPCFSSRFGWLEFGVLWKQGIACCCESKTSVTYKNIWNQIRPLSEYIDFKNLSDEEMRCIPESEREKLLLQQSPKSRKDIHIQGAGVDVSPSSRGSNECRYGKAGVLLPEHAKIFKTTSNAFTEVVLKGNFILFEFSINKNAILPQFSIFHLGPPIFSKLKSLHIYKKNETFAMYRSDKDDDLEMVAIDGLEECELVFRARKDLFVQANKIYTVEVNSVDSISNLVWALVSLMKNSDGELEVTIRSERCYGLKYLSFLPDF